MNKLKGILLTQGMHGMISQVEGLAKALDIDFSHHTVELNNFWKMIPPKLTPISQSEIKRLIKGSGVKINNRVISDEKLLISEKLFEDNAIKLSLGKKRHIKVEIS